MKTLVFALTALLLIAGLSCSNAGKTASSPLVVITTDFGDIKVRLSDETPKHRDNFLKLAREGFYDELLFHRVINHFMIQGGDPASKSAQPGARVGGGDPGYTLPAEIIPTLIHKKGALAAARKPDQINPDKQSSGSQFYIVQGKVWRPGELDTLEMQLNAGVQQSIFRQQFARAQAELDQYRQKGNQEAFNLRVATLRAEADSLFQIAPKMKFTDAQRQAYTTVGGYPSLDGGYTVFGEVVEGLDILDKIAAVPTDPADRPLQDIRMKVKVVE